jgi:hypothetical protein
MPSTWSSLVTVTGEGDAGERWWLGERGSSVGSFLNSEHRNPASALPNNIDDPSCDMQLS